MPKRTDIRKIMIIGSGPIVIGQACEFDYSGTQACKALREEGYEIVLLNSNPATIMTDPETADRTYVEPITTDTVEKIVAAERPDALLPTLGGQTALNISVASAKAGILGKHGVELIGANVAVIERAEERELFKAAMASVGLACLKSELVTSVEAARQAAGRIGFPIIVRPSFTLGGTGGGIAQDMAELARIVEGGLDASMTHEVLVEESVLGWKEYEYEVMRDRNDNVVIICSIENQDPMGVHTGDSITVAPAQTLTDVEYQMLRDACIKVMRAIGVETGGSNVQFAVHPETGRMVVIEMNPRVSRSSALASKATGFPIAKIAAKLAVGYTLDELPNDITKETPASFEPAIDYCVVKIPRFAFEKFPTAELKVGVSMKSVGETMAIGRTYKEALQKALRGLEIGLDGLDLKCEELIDKRHWREKLGDIGTVQRLFYLKYGLKQGISVRDMAELTAIDPWFVDNIAQIVEMERALLKAPRDRPLGPDMLARAKRFGFSDRQIVLLRHAGDTGLRQEPARLFDEEVKMRAARTARGLKPVFRLVDTCAGEFEAYTPYYYSSYAEQDESRPSAKEKVVILGGGPNRIGQGIEFDYCCVHAAFALRELGYETIMVNSNPETVSTDYDTSDKLYFEPLTFEDVMNIMESEKPIGVIAQMGGQTPLNIATPLMKAGVRVLGTSAASINRAEDREECRQLLDALGLLQPDSATAMNEEQALRAARRIDYPVMIRPSYVLGGRAMMVAYTDADLRTFVRAAFEASPGFPVLIDRFLESAVEVDVDLVCDGTDVYVGGVMQHIEEAGIHSGDSACVTPPYTLGPEVIRRIEEACGRIALALEVKGLLNVQLAVKDGEIFIIEINPRASRTVPYVSKATGVPLAKVATRVAVGHTLRELGLAGKTRVQPHYAVKEAVFPFNRFAGVDPTLGPEMKSTGEVMGIDASFEVAYWKSQIAAGQDLRRVGTVFLSAKDRDKGWMIDIGRELQALGFPIVATVGTAGALALAGVRAEKLAKVQDEAHPNILDLMREDRICLLVNTPSGPVARLDEISIRAEAILRNVPLVTTQSGARATVAAIRHMRKARWTVRALQDYARQK
ncbi:MAG: carbamoyl-phosphate synthase large subunit [Kiritimatiellae bacterium]|nr:carbamoyl-phosphate synthase large subunit [Kiritimatiellia bacterium]